MDFIVLFQINWGNVITGIASGVAGAAIMGILGYVVFKQKVIDKLAEHDREIRTMKKEAKERDGKLELLIETNRKENASAHDRITEALTNMTGAIAELKGAFTQHVIHNGKK